MATQQIINITNDMNVLTKIPNKILTEIFSKEILCIGSAIHDAILNKEEAVIINIGIGSLAVELATMQCKFVPNKELRAVIKRSIEDKVDPIEFMLEQSIIDKLLNICDEVV